MNLKTSGSFVTINLIGDYQEIFEVNNYAEKIFHEKQFFLYPGNFPLSWYKYKYFSDEEIF